MATTDSRVQFTKAALKKALLKILKEKPISKVSIKELCEEASLNRGTFYLHYNEPNDLLREIEEDFIQEHFAHFTEYLNKDLNTKVFTELFISMIENKDVCIIIMGRNGNPMFMERVKRLLWPALLAEWRTEFPDYAERDFELVYEFIFPGATQIILRWLQNDGGLTTDQIARRLDRLGHYCHLAIREFN